MTSFGRKFCLNGILGKMGIFRTSVGAKKNLFFFPATDLKLTKTIINRHQDDQNVQITQLDENLVPIWDFRKNEHYAHDRGDQKFILLERL